MAKIIEQDLVIGNALISTRKEEITKDEIKQFMIILGCLLPKKYYIAENDNSFEQFCDDYSFLITKEQNKIILKCSIELLIKFFRLGLPTKIMEAFDNTAIKLNELKFYDLEEKNKEKVLIKK